MTLLSDQFREVAASLRPDAETLRLQRRAPAKVIPVPVPARRNDDGYGSYGMSCGLCGDERQSYSAALCNRCAPNARKL